MDYSRELAVCIYGLIKELCFLESAHDPRECIMETTRIDDEMSNNVAIGNFVSDAGRLEILTSISATQRIAGCILEHSKEITGKMTILEAGCGRKWGIDLEKADFELTGVDLDARALELRRTVTQDLDVGIVGTICDRNIVPLKYFDVVYSAYVLEHIDGALVALENFAEWVRPGGLIVMWLPNRNSVYGWIARHTPYRVHVWVYRYVFGDRNAGKPGFSPYPTCHDAVLAPDALLAFSRDHDLSIKEFFAVDVFSGRRGMKNVAIRAGMRIISHLSHGRLVDREVDLGIVMCKSQV